ncbi:Zinc finger, C2CH-type [Cinara cedri]|uniref:Zinc finger, C2CH-type n=1 Tax=Cinara cedri TaxID=506608 RepID=A0A5E4MBH3_9HEMI|nr:Zinc finger, C2CH-type [Cinara cedri]
MVQRCVVCYNNSNSNKDVSYHHFPKDKTKRTMWLKALNLTSVSSWQKVCSKHFNDSDFRFSYNRNILQSTAVPIGDYKPVEEHNYARNELKSPTHVRSSNIAMTSEANESVPSPSVSKTNNCEKENIIEISHPFPFILCTNVEVLPREPPPEKKRRIWSSSRIGDLREEDFSTPSKRRRNFCLVLNTVKKLRHKNKILNQRNQRLQKKVSSLQDIIKGLKNKKV